MTDKPSTYRLKLEAVYLRQSVGRINSNLDDVVNGDTPYDVHMKQQILDDIEDVRSTLQRLTEWMALVEVQHG